MTDKIYITIILLLAFGTIITMIRDLGKCRNPSTFTMSLAVGALIFAIFGFNLVLYDIEIGTQYTKISKDPFRPIEIYEVINIDDNYVQYLHIGNGYVFTNSATMREFYHDVER